MSTLLMVLLGQVVFAVVVIFVLMKLLNKELIKAAFEKLESCKIPSDIKEISVFSASTISDEFISHLESIRQRRFNQANVNFLQNAELKGGIVIAAGDLLLDFSLASRLQQFWS